MNQRLPQVSELRKSLLKATKGYHPIFPTSINRCLTIKHVSLETLLEITPAGSVLIPAVLWNCIVWTYSPFKEPDTWKTDSGTTDADISVHELCSSSLTGVICLQAISMSNSKIALFVQSADVCRLEAIRKCIKWVFPLTWCTSGFNALFGFSKSLAYIIISGYSLPGILFWLQAKKALSKHKNITHMLRSLSS